MTKLYCYLQAMLDDERGQDMVEYALLAGFVAVAAGATIPNISNSISTVFSKAGSLLTRGAA